MGGTFKTVFWSLFGLSEKDGVKLGNYQNRFTEIIGYLIYGTFNIASVIVLLNMLIAMMSKSYETIEEHADVEWKFARSKLYMEYIKEGKTNSFLFIIYFASQVEHYQYHSISFQVRKVSIIFFNEYFFVKRNHHQILLNIAITLPAMVIVRYR
jgi:ACR3 family arsenite efflux pump ArsB